MDEPTITPGAVGSQDEGPDNLLEQLAAKRREISEIKETFIPIPGYDREPPMLLAKYRLLDGPEIARIGNKIRRETKNNWDRQVHGAIDTFIAACVGIFVDKGDGEPPVPLTLNGEEITGYTEAFASALQFEAETARGIVLGVFAHNEIAISQHSFLLNRWFSDTSIDVTKEFLEGNL